MLIFISSQSTLNIRVFIYLHGCTTIQSILLTTTIVTELSKHFQIIWKPFWICLPLWKLNCRFAFWTCTTINYFIFSTTFCTITLAKNNSLLKLSRILTVEFTLKGKLLSTLVNILRTCILSTQTQFKLWIHDASSYLENFPKVHFLEISIFFRGLHLSMRT
jgi:hypothetical protein